MPRAPSHFPQAATRGPAPLHATRRGGVTFCSEATPRGGQASRSEVGVLGCPGCPARRPYVLLSARRPSIILLYSPSCRKEVRALKNPGRAPSVSLTMLPNAIELE